MILFPLQTAVWQEERFTLPKEVFRDPPETGGFSEVGALSLSGGRQLPSQLLVGLEGSGGGRLGSGGSAGWLSDPLRPSTSSIQASSLPAGVLPTVHQGSRLNPGASDPSSEGGSRTSPSVSGFLQPSIPRPEGFGVVAPHHRSVYPERLHHLVALPHGDSSVGLSVHPPGRLDDLSGPAGSSSSRFASLSSLRGSREVVPVQGPLLRSYDRAPCLHEDYGSRFRHPPQVWGQDASLPGRLAHPDLYRTCLFTIEGQAPVTLHRTWHPGQPHEVVSSSHSVTSVSRHGDSVSAFYSSTYSSTSQQSPAPDRGVSVKPISSSVPLASSSGPLIVPHSSRLWRDAPNEAAPTLPQGPVGLPGRPVSGLLVPSLSRGSSLVGVSGPAARRSESLSPSPGRQLLLRCVGCRLGGPRRRTPRLGPLVSSSEDSLHQPERASSSSVRPEGLRTPVGGSVGSTVLRQHHHSHLSSSFGRNVLFHSERHSKGDTPLGGESPCPSPAAIHHGLVQCHSGRSQSPQSSDWVGMDPSSGGSRSTGPQMASGDRSVCNLPDREAYAFPPIAIIRRVLVKLRSSRNCELTLIAPFWPQREWFPDLLELLSDVPITLSSRKDLLRQPHFHRFHQNLPMLQLTAWRLSSDSPVRPASLLRWLDNLSSVEDCPHA